MSRQVKRLCAWCLRSATGAGDLTISLSRPGAEAIELRWHLERCADEDPLHAELADALGLPDGGEGEKVVMGIYLRIVRRVRSSGPEALRGAIHVRRDFPTGPLTLRGAGQLWGVQSLRLPGPRRVPRPRR